LGWVGSTTAKVLKIWKDYFNAFKAQLDQIWLHQAVKLDFMGRSDRYQKLIRRSNKVIMLANDSQYCVGSGWVQIFFTCSGLRWVSQLIGWVGLGHKKWTHGQLWCHAISWRRKLNRDTLMTKATVTISVYLLQVLLSCGRTWSHYRWFRPWRHSSSHRSYRKHLATSWLWRTTKPPLKSVRAYDTEYDELF